MEKINMGISACLLGQNVRYDGGHSHDRFLTDTLGQYIQYIPICPEVGLGLPVPREVIQLEGDPGFPRLMKKHTRQDITDTMVDWARDKTTELENTDLWGFIFKSRSPSCGIERVKVFNERGTMPVRKGVGIFAGIFMEHFPLLPVEDDGRIHNPILRDNFIERVFTLNRWRDFLKRKKGRGNLVDFHTRHKLLILSRSRRHYRAMGSLVAKAKDLSIMELYGRYQAMLVDALRLNATPKKNADAMMHMMGYFKKQLTSGKKQELLGIIDNYRKGYLPLIVPVTLITHYVGKYDEPYLKQQTYLNPHPLELQLRNHV